MARNGTVMHRNLSPESKATFKRHSYILTVCLRMHYDWVTAELVLSNWRAGSTQAERLCSSILHIDGFENIEPQAPLGGADDRKDLLCSKAGREFVAAVYFPNSQKKFPTISRKFLKDLEGPIRHNRVGIVFLTNQLLTVKEHDKLVSSALERDKECIIYNVERIKSILDAPNGYGIRLEYLKIPMTPEEQFTFFVHSSNTIERALERNSHELSRISSKIDQVLTSQDYANQTIRQVATSSGFEAGPPPSQPDLRAGGNFKSEPIAGFLSSNITPELLISIHRLSCYELPPRMVGQLRTEDVWLGTPGSLNSNDMRAMLAPRLIFDALTNLCSFWNKNYSGLKEDQPPSKLLGIATFHANLLNIHPFLDGNGRVARALMMQQCIDLFGQADMTLLDKGASYFLALEEADNDNFERLSSIIAPVVDLQLR